MSWSRGVGIVVTLETVVTGEPNAGVLIEMEDLKEEDKEGGVFV